MPAYIFRALLGTISPELRRRMQGTSCFRFARSQQLDGVEDELRQLIAGDFERMQREYDV